MAIMTTAKNDREELHLLMNGLAEDVADTEGKDLGSDSDGTDAERKAKADRVRNVLVGAILKAKKARLLHARQEHAATASALKERSSRLPQDPATRRLLLKNVIARRPEMRKPLVTFQHREFESFTDDDVESALRQLDALGALNDEEADDT